MNQYIEAGGKIVFAGSKNGAAFLNSIFGTSLVYAFVTMPTTRTGAASGTRFMNIAGQLPALQAVYGVLAAFDAPESIVVCIGLQLCAIFGIGFGAGILIVSGLGAGSGELFASAASDRTGHPESRVRPAIELSWVVLGVVLGGPAGLGTVMVAAFIAPAVECGYRIIDGLAVRSRRTMVTTRGAIISRELTHSAR